MLACLKRQASQCITHRFGNSTSQRRLNTLPSHLRAGTCGAVVPSEGGTGTFLLEHSVTAATKDADRRAVLFFLLFCEVLCFDMSSGEAIDICLCAFFDECWLEGLSASTGDLTICGWCDLWPAHRPAEFPRDWRAVRSWRRLRPPCTRHPMPWLIAAALVTHMAWAKSPRLAIAFLVMFDGYLRPYELLNARWRDLLPPAVQFPWWCLVVCPITSGRPSKTKMFHDGVAFAAAAGACAVV